MDSARWQKIEAAFHELKPLSLEDREDGLHTLRDEDSDLADQVEDMLAADRRSNEMLGGILETAVLDALDRLPESIGHYQVVSRIGTGGFSSVYLAQPREDPSQQVAIKVLQRGLPTPDVRRRLVQESQILARLNHPYIARLLGTGATQDGEPYFVMEYVDGEPIDRYCDANRLTIPQRLKLFRLVCSAVDYAHHNLVIHRDIKPSNLLVTKTGSPKLLDFGIAKLLQPNLIRGEPLHTAPGGSFMTPDFASPEQIREEPLTTATDVYSLGGLLYRLLCGRPPYRFPNRSPKAIEEIISTVEPGAPSVVIFTASAPENAGTSDELAAEEVAGCRQTTLKQLSGQLDGDLDSIVLTALSKQPEQRYSSVEQFSLDLARHSRSEPVKARRITRLARARKFILRHRVGAAVATLILVTLLTAVAITTRATFRAEAERIRAERHLIESQQVAQFVIGIFEVSDPEIAQGREVTARQLLDRGATDIATRLERQPGVKSTLMTTMGKIYRNLGDHQKSREFLEQVLAERQARLPSSDPLVIEGQYELARSLMVQGDHHQASKLLQAARSALHASGRTTTSEAVQNLNLLAESTHKLNQLTEAESLYRQALRIGGEVLQPDDPQVIDSLIGLAQLLAVQNNFDDAESIFREALELRRSRLGNLHPDVAIDISNLAYALHGQGRFEEAEQAIREAMRLRSTLYGDNHWIVQKSYNNLAQVLIAQGRVDEAIPWIEKALEVGRAQLGAEHPQVTARLVNLALAYKTAGRAQEAESLLLEALIIHQRTLGENHPATARNLYSLAGLYAETGRGTAALPLLQRVLGIFDTTLPQDDYRRTHALYLRGRVLAELGDCQTATASLEKALHLRLKKHPQDHPQVEQVQGTLDRCAGILSP